MKTKKQFLFLLLLGFLCSVGNVWGDSYVPLALNTISEYTVVYGSDITGAGNPAEDWVVVPSYGTSSKSYSNVTSDTNGNPNSLIDNLTAGSKSAIQIKTDGNTYTSQKRVIHMHVKGVITVTGHGVAGSSGYGMNIAVAEYKDGLSTFPTTGIATVTRKNNSGSYIVQKTGLDASKEYIISIYAAGGDNYFYAVELLPAPYNVTYQAGAGTGADVVDETYTVGDCPNTFTAPVGLAFAGWKDGLGNSYAVGSSLTGDVTLIAQWGLPTPFVLYSMTDVTAPSDAIATKATTAISATYNNGEGHVYNGKGSSTAVVSGNQIALGGSSNSYFNATITSGTIKKGDIITIAEGDANFYISGTSTKPGSATSFTSGSYTVPEGSNLIGSSNVYIWKGSTSSFASFTINSTQVITKVSTPTYELGAWDKVSGKYAVTLACETEGTTIKYSVDNKESYSDYSSALALSPGTTLDAYAVRTGLENSDNMEQYVVPAAPDYNDITFAAGEGLGSVPEAIIDYTGVSFTLPSAPLLYKEGYTLTKWNDGEEDHLVGSSIDVTSDVTLTGVFEANTVNIGDEAVEVIWSFQRSEGCPMITIEGVGATKVYTKRIVLNEKPFDALMTIDATDGKFNNSASESYAQVNANTKFTIPAIHNMVVTLKYNQTPTAVDNASFDGNDADEFNTGEKTLTYTYKGVAPTMDVIELAGNKYPEYISVSYPIKKMKYDAPTITAESAFNFENKGYKVTFAATDGTLMVSEDGGSSYEAQTSPYVTYALTTTSYKAKVEGALTTSDIASKEVTNTFDPAKSYVAWVYTKGYGSASYAFATDPMVVGLQTLYNVVEIDLNADTDPTSATDIDNADLIVCTEAMTGNKTLSNKMKTYAGSTPMIGLKAYNYTKGRWSWGAPANPASTTQSFTPKSSLYKLFDGVSFEPDGKIKLATTESGNVIQTVEFGTTDCTAPTGNVIMGTIGGDDTKAVMYVSNKYFGLGLSSDCWSTYTQNAVTIVKNAAAMLIAGGSLVAEDPSIDRSVTCTVGEYEWATITSTLPLDFNESAVKAYLVTGHEGNAITKAQMTGTVPAGTPLLLNAAADTYEIPVVASSSTVVSANKLKAGTGAAVSAEAGKTKYVLAAVEDVATFLRINETSATVPVGKAYLEFDEVIAGAPALRIVEENQDATGIDDIEASEKAIKFIENGRILIKKNGIVYDALGRIVK